MISNPNIRKRALGMIGQMNTDALVQMLGTTNHNALPKSEWEIFKLEMAKEMGKAEELKNSMNLPTYLSDPKINFKVPKHPMENPSQTYSPGYAPKGQAPGGTGSGVKHPYLDDDAPKAGTHSKFEVRAPMLAKVPKKEREYLDDELQSTNEETPHIDLDGAEL